MACLGGERPAPSLGKGGNDVLSPGLTFLWDDQASAGRTRGANSTALLGERQVRHAPLVGVDCSHDFLVPIRGLERPPAPNLGDALLQG
jgi:hypothetical protein